MQAASSWNVGLYPHYYLALFTFQICPNQGGKMKKFFAKTKFVQLVIIVLILLILDGLLSYNSFLYNHSISANQIASSIPAEEPIGEIVEGITIVQEIPVQKDISNISVLFATYGRINKGDLFVEIVGKESGLIYGKQKYDVSTFSDNSFVTIPFDVMASSQDDSTLYLQITSDSQPGSAITAWKSKQSTSNNLTSLKINDALISGELVYTVFEQEVFEYWSGERIIHILFIIFLVIIYFAFVESSLHNFNKNNNNFYLYIVLFLLGLIILFFRSAYNFLVPSLYTEDGIWSASIINDGIFHTLVYARSDYFVFGNVLLLQIALSINGLFHGDSILYLPVYIACVQYAFYSLTALLPIWCFRFDFPKYIRIIFWFLIILVPTVGMSGYEIWGKISNVGYLFYFIALCLLYNRIFNGSKNTKLAIVITDIILFISCGTHEGVYVLVLVGFILDAILQMKEISAEGFVLKIKKWLSIFRNKSWIVLGVFYSIIAIFDLFFLTASQNYHVAANQSSIIELWARFVLFYFIFPFYNLLNNQVVITLFIIIMCLLVFTFYKTKLSDKDTYRFVFCIFGSLFYCVIAFIARFDIMTSILNDYSLSSLDRFFYAINITCLVPMFYWLSILLKKGTERCKFIVNVVLLFLIFALCINYKSLFPYDNAQTEVTHKIPFSQRLEEAEFDSNSNLYKVDIDFEGWSIQLPEETILASLDELKEVS